MTSSKTVCLAARVSLSLLLLSTIIPAMGQVNVQGQWTTQSTSMPINPIHAALMHNGKILIVAGSGNCAPSQSGCPTGPPYGASNSSGAGVYDPATGIFTQLSVSWDMFCNGMVVLPDGRPFINSGTLQYDPFYGSLKSSIFDPSTNTFTDVQNMAHGRWYPTLTTLGDGRVMTFSGSTETGATNTTVEIYTVGSGWSAPTNSGFTPPLYPRMHLLPSGKVFYSGSGTTSALFNPANNTWSLGVATTNYSGQRTYGTSVLLPLTPANNYDPKVIIMGGNSPATATTEIIDLGAGTLKWNYGPSMSQPRIEMNAVILPTGNVLAVGGSTNDEDTNTLSLNADLYNTATNTFSSAGANASQRLYHSVALLLPDASVWVAGGNPARGTYNHTMEIYKPAYLFNSSGGAATRPSISSAPTSISWGNAFTVQTPDAASISSAVLVRNGAVTHAFNMDQRLVGMSFTVGSGSLTVTAPPNGNIAPPGWYMLFLVNSSGVPSVGTFVQLGAGQADFSISGSPSSQSVAPGSGTAYTATVTALNGFTGSTALSVSGLPTGATASFNPTTVTGSGSSTMTVTTSGNTPTGSSTLTIKGTSGSLVHTTTVTLIVTTGGTTGSLAGSLATPSGTQNLTTLGTLDWAHWGLTSGTSFDHKAGVTSQISNYTVVGTGAVNRYADNAFGYTWTGGTPTASATNSTTGVYISGVGNGFQITVPADTTQRTLMVYVDAYHAQGKMVAHLSDASSPDYVNTAINSTSATVQGGFTFVYQAASSGQTLSVTFTNIANNVSDANIALEAAALVGTVGSPDFSLGAAPGSQSVAVGGSTSYTATVTGQNGFTGSTGFGVSGLPTGATASFSPTTVTGTGSSTMTVTTSSSTPVGGYTLTITGTSGTLVHSTTVTLAVTAAADFSLGAAPASQSVAVGGGTSYTATVTALNGFTGSTALSVSGLPTGATASFNPTTVTGSGSSTMTVTTSGSTPTGSSTLTIKGTSGSLVHTTTVTLIVTTGGTTGSLAGSLATPSGTQNLTTLGTLDWAHWGLTSGTSFDHKAGVTSQISNYTVVGTGAVNQYADNAFGYTWTGGTPTASATNSTTGVYISGVGNGFQITVPADTTQRTLMVYVDAYHAQGKMVAHLSDASSPDYVNTAINSTSATVQGGFTFVYQAASSGQTLSVTFTNIANNVSDANIALEAAALVGTVGSPDFSLGAAPGSQSVAVGGSTSYTATVTGQNGFTGSTGFGVSGLPTGATASFSPTTVTGTGSSTMTVTTSSSTPVGSSTLTITGTSGTLVHSTTVTLVVTAAADFSLGAAPGSQSVAVGGGTSYTATVTPSGGFSGIVTFSASGLPTGATASFNPTTVTGTGSSTMTVTTSASTPVGSSTLTITGTSGALVHTTTVTLTVTAAANFSLAATPGTQSVAAGGGTSYTATVTPSGGFSGIVTFSASGLPTGATASFSPTTVTGTGSSTMTVTTGASTPVGSSTLTLTGTSGTLVHTTTVTLTVTSGGTTGSLAGSLATPAGTQNLTSLGAVDWAHWGLTSATSFDHKAGVTSQISNFTVVGTGTANRYPDNAFGFTWTGGTPTASATNSTTGLYIEGVGNGFQITAPADTTQRTLTVYVDSYHAQGKLVAHLSDTSSPDYVNTTISSTGATVQGAFTFVYKAASSGQTLSVTFTNINNNVSDGNIALEAATLN